MATAPNGNGRVEMARRLVRINAHLLGAVLMLLFGASLFVATLGLHLQGGSTPGQMLSLLHHFFPGYSVSLGGAFVGGFWGAVFGYGIGYVLGRAYGPWMLHGASLALEAEESGEFEGTVLRLRALPFALVSGTLLAGALFLATNWLYFRYGYASPHLELLANYLPGYTSDFAGSFAGAFWLFLYAFVGAFGVAWIYDRVVAARHAR